MIFLGLVINLWHIMRNPNTYEKGIIHHLSVNPKERDVIKKWSEMNDYL